MHEFLILKDIVILLFTLILTSLLSHRIKIPAIIGFIVVGVIIGPFGIGLIHEKELVEVMAEIGVVLLLFTIGIEFSLTEIAKVGTRGLTVAILQVGLSTLLVAGLLYLFKVPVVEAFFIGFVITLSSTAIVLKLYMEAGEMESAQGRLCLGTLLTQDMAIVPMVLFLQIFGSGSDPSLVEAGKALGIAVLAVAGIIVAAYYIVPLFLHQVVRLRSPEVLTMAGIFICLGTAWLSSHFGLSLALGAFIAGIVISESEYSHQITATVMPFRDIFNSIFFISIGMLIRFDSMLEQWLPIIILTAIIIVFKSLLIFIITFVMRYPLRIALIVGLSLAQVGEFSFVLLKIGEGLQLMEQSLYQIFLSAIVLSMFFTPLLIKVAPGLATRLPNLIPRGGDVLADINARTSSVINHVIIAGYGLIGEHLATVLQKTGISYVIVDINHENVKKAKEAGHIAYYGDTSYAEVLRSVGVAAAKIIVFTIADPAALRRGIKIAREINPKLHIIVRTKYMGEIAALSELGADQVIPEEFETSVEIFSRVLKEYKIPGNIIQNQIDLVRFEGYAMLRGSSLTAEKITAITEMLAASTSDSFYLEEGSPAISKSIRSLNLRYDSGASIIAVARGGKTRTNPPPDFVLDKGDILVLLGSHEEILVAQDILKGEEIVLENQMPRPDSSG
ncbi:MAG: cation:proton antiporter [Proteobacteria bacterium]|nr:cation:proton antiporter [Pseudomonadota bacterium]